MCGITVNEVDMTVGNNVGLTYARRLSQGGAAGGGDSGGPLFRRTYDSSEGRDVARPMGLVVGPLNQAEYNNTNCRNRATICNYYIYFSGLRDAEIVLGFTMVDP